MARRTAGTRRGSTWLCLPDSGRSWDPDHALAATLAPVPTFLTPETPVMAYLNRAVATDEKLRHAR